MDAQEFTEQFQPIVPAQQKRILAEAALRVLDELKAPSWLPEGLEYCRRHNDDPMNWKLVAMAKCRHFGEMIERAISTALEAPKCPTVATAHETLILAQHALVTTGPFYDLPTDASEERAKKCYSDAIDRVAESCSRALEILTARLIAEFQRESMEISRGRPRVHRENDSPADADLKDGRSVYRQMVVKRRTATAFRKEARKHGMTGSNLMFGRLFRLLENEESGAAGGEK